MKRILLTGMFGRGKSTVIGELAARGFKAVDLNQRVLRMDRGLGASKYPLPNPIRTGCGAKIAFKKLLSTEDVDILFLSGCAENMEKFLPQF